MFSIVHTEVQPGSTPRSSVRFGLLYWVLVLVALKSGRADEKPLSPEQYDALVKPTDREHWAYQPVRKPVIPKVRNAAWTRNPIDNFILAKLEAKGWTPAEPVSRRGLLRRVYLNLIGIPPTPAEQRRFLADRSPNAFEKVIDDLLSRPGHGERYARHWLDLVRYAETNGYERDATKPQAWRYRDYVIASLNADKPYNRFVLEQLAGDELPDRNTETVIATGYYRLGPWDDEPADPKQDRFDQLDDLVRTTSRVFLGLTLGCARCHNHKFDALTAHDYYRMAAIFAPLSRPRNGRMELDRPAVSRAELARVSKRETEIRRLDKAKWGLRFALQAEFLAAGRSRLPKDAVAAFQAQPGNRTPRQKQLVARFTKQLDAEIDRAMPKTTAAKIVKLQQRIMEMRRELAALPRGYFLVENSPAPVKINLLLRGRASNPGPEVRPGVPTVLAKTQPKFQPPDTHTTRQRLSFARWLVDPAHPLTARVIVNRVWQYHFGEGIVASSSDFGVIGARPTHPELLDWMTYWFVHDANWSLKKLHRLILTSSTYRMSKRQRADYAKADPENASFWRFPYRRMEVEVIRDSMLAAGGQLNRKMRGPSTYLSIPIQALAGHSDPNKVWKPLDEREASRRTVYAFIKRSLVVPMLEVLDLCDTTRSSEKRNVTSVPTQALTLLNGEFTNRQARHFAERLQRDAGSNADQQIRLAYRLALCREPRDAELSAFAAFLHHEAAAIVKERSISPEVANSTALRRLCRVMFNLNEFVYPD
jgi:Protein of unknown function (DUF1553)/Protein of unknown function (DUF1549)